MNPKQSPLQSGQLMSRALPPPRPGFRRALTMLRYYKGISFAFLSLLSGKKKKK